MTLALRKKAETKKKEKTNLVTLTRYFRYDLTGGGLPFGHTHEDAAELTFQKGRSVWRTRSSAVDLQLFVEKHGKSVGERQNLPYDKDYDSRSYSQQYELPSEFTFAVLNRVVSQE